MGRGTLNANDNRVTLRIQSHGDVTQVLMTSTVGRSIGYDVSAYLTRSVLVDLGFPLVARAVARYLTRARPDGILITHHHEDHGGNAELAARMGIPIGASDATLALLQQPVHLALHRRVIWGNPPPLRAPITAFSSDALRLVPTPGHASDHHIVWDAERETIFGGDLFLGVKVRAAHPDERPRALVRSLRHAAALRPRRFFDAHRGVVRDPVSALLAKADWLDDTIGAIERRIAEGWSNRAIARAVLGREDLGYYVSRGAMSRLMFVARVRDEVA